MDMDDVQSELKALKKLYSIHQIRGNAQHGLAHAHETLDEESRLLSKRLLDGDTEQAWIQFHANTEEAASTTLLPEAPRPSVNEKDDVDPVGTRSRNKMAADYYSTHSTNKELETSAACAAPPPNKLHFKTHHPQPCPGLVCIHCKHQHHHHHHLLLRRGPSMTSCRYVNESAAAAAKETSVPPVLQSLRLTGRTRTLTPRRTEAPIQTQRIKPPPTHEIPGQSRRKHMDSSPSLAKDGSTKKTKEERGSKKPGDDALKDERTMKSHAQPTSLHKTDSVRRRVQSRNKSALTKLVGPTSQKKLQLPHDNHVAGRKKDREGQGDSRTAASMHQKQQQRPCMKREGGTEQRKKVGATLKSQRSISHGRSRMSYSYKKLPPSATVEFQSQTSSSYTITESMDESASGTSNSSSTSLSQRTSEEPWMRKKSLIHKAQRKYYSSPSSSSSSSPRPASSLRPRPRAVREEPAEKRRGRLRRFKDKLAVIFHHHYHRGSSGGDSEVESPTHRRGSWKPSGAGAVIRAPRHRHRHRHRHHGHLYTLLQWLLRHVWHSRMEEEKAGERGDEMGKKSCRLVGMGRNCRWVQGAAGGGGVKLGSRKNKPPLGLGLPKAQRNKIQAS